MTTWPRSPRVDSIEQVIATRPHRDPAVAAVLQAAGNLGDDEWVPLTGGRSACENVHGQHRDVVVDSPRRRAPDDRRREQLLECVEDDLIKLTNRVRAGRLKDPAKIGPTAQRILGLSPVNAASRPVSARAGSTRTTTPPRSTTNSVTSRAPPRALNLTHHTGIHRGSSRTTRASPVWGVVSTSFPAHERLLGSANRVPTDRDSRPRAHRHLRPRRGDQKPSSPTNSTAPTSSSPTNTTRSSPLTTR